MCNIFLFFYFFGSIKKRNLELSGQCPVVGSADLAGGGVVTTVGP